MKQFIYRIIYATINFLSLQLFLSLAALPILASWGLPISLMSPIGNFVFSPFLTAFLLLSSIVFFCELAHIPNGFFVWILELISRIWQWTLSCNYGSMLYACKKPALWMAICILLVAFLSTMHHTMKTPLKRFITLLILFIACWLTCNRFALQPGMLRTIACQGKQITHIFCNETSVVIDPGALGRRISAPSWASYTLAPDIIGATGRATIDHMIITKPGIVLFEALTELCIKIPIKNLYMPTLEGIFDTPFKRKFNRFYAIAKQHGVRIIRFSQKPITIHISETDSICITPQPSRESYRTIEYSNCLITGIIDKQSVTLYDSKQHVNRLRSTDLPCH